MVVYAYEEHDIVFGVSVDVKLDIVFKVSVSVSAEVQKP